MELKLLKVKKEKSEKAYNNSLPVPLRADEIVIVEDQDEVGEGYVRVRHGSKENKTISIFDLGNFTKVNGDKIR